MVLIDGQAGIPASGAAGSPPLQAAGAPAGAYGLVVSGGGIAPTTVRDLRVQAGMAPVDVVVSAGLPLDGLNDADEGPSPSGKALAGLAAPPAPTNLRVEAVTDSSARVLWDATEGATDSDVNYKPAVGGRWTNQPHRGIGLSNTITDLEPGTAYRWAVRAENSDGRSEWVFGPNFTTVEEETDEATEEEEDGGLEGPLAAGPIRRLTNDPADDWWPSWSPDGRHLAFASSRDDNYEIYVMGADGSNPRNLTNHSATDGEPSWSPDGRHLAFESFRDDNWEIYVMGADGSNLRRLTNHSAWDDNPFWSPDGRHLAFNSDRAGNWEIYVMELREEAEGGDDGGGDDSGGDAISTTISDCSGTRYWGPFTSPYTNVYIYGTIQANETVSDLTIIVSYDGYQGSDYIGDLSAGQSERFSVTVRVPRELFFVNCGWASVRAEYVTSGSAKVIAGEVDLSEQIRVQGSSSASSARINRKRSVEQFQGRE